MVLSASADDGLGLLQPVVDAELARGAEVRLEVGSRIVRGDPPHGELVPGRSRAEVEAVWDVGPLVAWYPTPQGWRLEDSTTLATLDLGAEPATPAEPPLGGARARLGHPSDDVRFETLSGAEADAGERARVEQPSWRPPPPPPDYAGLRHLARRVETEEPADLVLERLQEVLAAVLTGQPGEPELPGWFRAACAPPHGSAEELVRRREAVALRGRAARRAGWALRWTPEEVLRHLDPAERIWRFHSARVVEDHALDVAVEVAAPWVPTTSLKWLLAASGAARCRPGVPPTELGFGWAPAPAAG